MARWQEIWEGEGASTLWTIPDPQVVKLAAKWKPAQAIPRILDLGCGVGRHVHLLASAGFDVFGLDHSSAGLEVCRQRLHSDGLTASLQCGEMGEIPFPEGFFDAAVAFNSIYHGTFEQVQTIAALLHRKLRTGGECLVTLPSRQNRMDGRGETLAPHTFVSPGMFPQLFGGDGERGVPHYFSSQEDVRLFFRDFHIESLDHEELHLARPGRHGEDDTWLRIPHAFFWRVVARK